jgi:hypothetical protein
MLVVPHRRTVQPRNNNIQSYTYHHFVCVTVPHLTDICNGVVKYDRLSRVNVRVIALLTTLATAIEQAIIPLILNYRMY